VKTKNPELTTEFEQTSRSLRQNQHLNASTIEEQLDMTIQGMPRVPNRGDPLVQEERGVLRRAVNSRPGLTDEEY